MINSLNQDDGLGWFLVGCIALLYIIFGWYPFKQYILLPLVRYFRNPTNTSKKSKEDSLVLSLRECNTLLRKRNEELQEKTRQLMIDVNKLNSKLSGEPYR